jgi:hypothetical protein
MTIPFISCLKKTRILLSLFLTTGLLASHAMAHGPEGPRGIVRLDWSLDHISRILSVGYGEILGPHKAYPTIKEIDGCRCATGSLFAFDVDDEFAFDMDEVVELELVYHATSSDSFRFLYDRNAAPELMASLPTELTLDPSPGERWRRHVIRLERARFANRLPGKTDFIIAVAPTITLCDIAIKRTHQREVTQETGWVDIQIHDGQSGKLTPVRMGIYDQTGRTPLPSDDALSIKYYGDEMKQIYLRTAAFIKSREPWPVDNRYVFYSNGHYRTQLPAGTYELVAGKGPEYRMVHQPFTVKADHKLKLNITMTRWDNMPAKGWYSGDGHIHVTRQSSDNQDVSAFLQAEDIHVSNLLEMGNATTTHFHQYAFGEKGRHLHDDYALVPGVEDPRTSHRGHTISINIEKPARERESYYLFHRAFEAYARQGGLSGYAHVGSGWFNENRGLALDVPFGVVDFVEIMQSGSLYVEEWYDFLNLGYELIPLAGSDFPYLDQPGAVRNYVKLDSDFSTQGWFDALRKGYTFVTNGPILSMTVNGQAMGSSLHVKRGDTIAIEASARINPDFYQLDRLELVVHGDVVKSVTVEKEALPLNLSHEMKVDHGLWIAARAYGKKHAISHTAPVYITVEGQGTWCAEKAPGIVEKMRKQLESLREDPIAPHMELEVWEAAPGLEELWNAQKPEIDKRIDEALRKYEQRLKEIRATKN